MTPLDAALVAAVLELSPARSGAPVTVGPPADPILEALRAQGARVLAAAGEAARLVLGAGVALAGVPAVVLAGEGAVTPRRVGPGTVAVVRHGPAGEVLRRMGWTVAQPVWPTDVEVLLHAALAAGGPVTLRLHGGTPAAPPTAGAAQLGVPRVVARGPAAVLVASGLLAADLRRLARGLERHGLAATAVDAHTRPAGSAGPSVEQTDAHILVGGPRAAAEFAAGRLRLGSLRPVEVASGDPDAADAVADDIPIHG